jgi:hypothetical protein
MSSSPPQLTNVPPSTGIQRPSASKETPVRIVAGNQLPPLQQDTSVLIQKPSAVKLRLPPIAKKTGKGRRHRSRKTRRHSRRRR